MYSHDGMRGCHSGAKEMVFGFVDEGFNGCSSSTSANLAVHLSLRLASFFLSLTLFDSTSGSQATIEAASHLAGIRKPSHMLPTPDTGHVPFQRVYEPAEDSYLLLDTLSSDSEKGWLQSRFGNSLSSSPRPSPLIAEIGTGSGVVLAFVNAHAEVIFGRSDVLTIGIDVNSYACEATVKTVRIAAQTQAQLPESHGHYLGNIVGDLTTPLRAGVVDILIFNPPYVPTPDLPALPVSGLSLEKPTFEDDSHFLALSYAGGADGMETTDRLLVLLPQLLSSRGVAYILLGAQNLPEAVKARIRGWGASWTVETVGSSGKKAGWEKLQIIRIARLVQ